MHERAKALSSDCRCKILDLKGLLEAIVGTYPLGLTLGGCKGIDLRDADAWSAIAELTLTVSLIGWCFLLLMPDCLSCL